MKLYSENENYKLYQGSMLDMLEVIEHESIDSIVTDPPYELNFMGKGWDNSGIAFQSDTWKKCYEVLKPGGYLLAFGGSRTFHRIACAIEDAGFEIRDTIMWLYGMGFPKSQNIGKQLEKRLEDEKTKQKTEYDLRLMWERDIQKTERKLQRCKVCEMSKRVFIDGEERWICNGTQTCDGKALREMFEQRGSCPSYRPQSEQQQDRKFNAIQEQCRAQESREVIEYWNKFGTALKPSFEPIIVARKPFKGSLVDNVIANGVGGINIDECRVGNEKLVNKGMSSLGVMHDDNWVSNKDVVNEVNGRFPANTILTYDETDFEEVCGGFPNTKNTTKTHIAKNSDNNVNFNASKEVVVKGYEDNGSASRYFYSAKASKKDRDEGLDNFNQEKVNDGRQTPIDNAFQRRETLRKNIHPTVKPTELMQYLIRLVTHNNAIILDPFNGSGSTGKAVMYENKERNKNYKYIGIELTEEYLPIAKARIEYVCNLENEKDNQTNIFDFIEGD